jgi:hypothetical protein
MPNLAGQQQQPQHHQQPQQLGSIGSPQQPQPGQQLQQLPPQGFVAGPPGTQPVTISYPYQVRLFVSMNRDFNCELPLDTNVCIRKNKKKKLHGLSRRVNYTD